MYKLSHQLARRFKPAKQAIIYSNLKFLLSETNFNSFIQHIKPLFSFDAQKSIPYYENWYPGRVSIDEGNWSNLGPIGNYPIEISVYQNAISHSSAATPVLSRTSPKPPPAPLRFVPALWDMVVELLDKKCISKTNAPATGHYFIQPKPNSTKIRAIFNGIFANSRDGVEPKKFSLPNFESLKPWLRSKIPLFFHRTDVQNYFWSYVLPPELQYQFVFSVIDPSGNTENFALLRAPFGWDFIPYIANETMHKILDPISSNSYSQLIYFDDHLGFSPHKNTCEYKTTHVRSSISDNGFLIHPPGSDKSSLVAETETHFVGKNIVSGKHPAIYNTEATNNSCLFASVVATAFRLSTKQIQSIAGILLWGTAHNRTGKPFMYGLHRIAAREKSHMFIRKYTRHNCIRAFLCGQHRWTPNDIMFAIPPSNIPLFFCDGSYVDNAAAMCGLLQGVPFYVRWKIPERFCSSQQLAELYTYVHSFRWLFRRYKSFALVTDSMSTLFSVQSLNAGVAQPLRARLLGLLAVCVNKLSDVVYAGWVPSEHHPADFASRSLKFTNCPLPYSNPHPLTSDFCKFDIFC